MPSPLPPALRDHLNYIVGHLGELLQLPTVDQDRSLQTILDVRQENFLPQLNQLRVIKSEPLLGRQSNRGKPKLVVELLDGSICI